MAEGGKLSTAVVKLVNNAKYLIFSFPTFRLKLSIEISERDFLHHDTGNGRGRGQAA